MEASAARRLASVSGGIGPAASAADELQGEHRPQQGAGPVGGVGQVVERTRRGRQLPPLPLDVGELVDHRPVPRAQLRIRRDAFNELALCGPLEVQDARIAQGLQPPGVRFQRVGQRERLVAESQTLPPHGIGRVGLAQGLEPGLEERLPYRHEDVPLVFQLRDGLQAVGGPGITDHEDGVSLGHAVAPREPVRRTERLAVLVDPVEREVQRVARVREVVRITPEEAHVELGRSDQADVGEAAEDIGRIAAAVVQRHDLHADPRRPGVLRLEPPTHLRDRPLPRLRASGFRRGVHRGVDLRGDVLRGQQLVGVRPRDGPLLVQRRCVEPVVEEAFARARDGGDRAARAMVVGHHQPVGRHEGRRAAGDAERGHARALEPLRRRVEAVCGREIRRRGVLERPHLAEVEAPGAKGVGGLGGAGEREGERGAQDEDGCASGIHVKDGAKTGAPTEGGDRPERCAPRSRPPNAGGTCTRESRIRTRQRESQQGGGA